MITRIEKHIHKAPCSPYVQCTMGKGAPGRQFELSPHVSGHLSVEKPPVASKSKIIVKFSDAAPWYPNVQCQHRPVWHQARPLHVTPTHPCHTRIENTGIQPPVVPECSAHETEVRQKLIESLAPREREGSKTHFLRLQNFYNFPQATDKTLFLFDNWIMKASFSCR